jgi:uncharacterized membrane protein
MLVIVATVVTAALMGAVIFIATQAAGWEAVYGHCGGVGSTPDCSTTRWNGAATLVVLVGLLLLAAAWVLTARGRRWPAVLVAWIAVVCPFLAAAVGSVFS